MKSIYVRVHCGVRKAIVGIILGVYEESLSNPPDCSSWNSNEIVRLLVLVYEESCLVELGSRFWFLRSFITCCMYGWVFFGGFL